MFYEEKKLLQKAHATVPLNLIEKYRNDNFRVSNPVPQDPENIIYKNLCLYPDPEIYISGIQVRIRFSHLNLKDPELKYAGKCRKICLYRMNKPRLK